MAIAITDFTNVKRTPLGASRYLVTGIYTGPASYTSGGETVTKAIASSAFGLSTIDCWVFGHLCQTTGAACGKAAFDHQVSGTTLGKIHLFEGTRAHSHDMLLKGGLSATSDEPLFLTDPGSAQNFGKNAATDRTIAGGSATTGGVQSNAVQGTNLELPSTSGAVSGFVTAFMIIGS